MEVWIFAIRNEAAIRITGYVQLCHVNCAQLLLVETPYQVSVLLDSIEHLVDLRDIG